MKINLFFIIILLFLLIPSQFIMLKADLFPSHDGLYHIERIKEFHSSILLGQFPPRIAPSIMDQIGYPLFVVNYQLPYYFAEIFMFLAQDAIVAYKAVMTISFLLSGIFASLLFKKTNSNLASLTGAIIFCYLPYRFANLYARGSFGESVAIMFVPLVLLSFHQISERKYFGVGLLFLSTFGLITSHSLIFLLFLPFIVFYLIIILKPERQILKTITAGIILGVTMSSFQLIPAIFEKKYLKFDQNLHNLFEGHFINIYQLFRIPKEGVNLGTPFQIGIVSTLIIFISFLYFFIKRNIYLSFFLGFILISIFATQPISSWFWIHIPFIRYILYPWRFLSIVVFCIAFLSVYLIDRIKFPKVAAVVLIFLALYSSRHYYLRPTQVEPSLPTPSLTTQNEFESIWSSEDTYNRKAIISSNQEVKIQNLNEKPFYIYFEAEVYQDTNFVLRKMYFPGWTLKVNGNDRTLDIKKGLISFDLPSGRWKIEAHFSETKLRKLANILSAGSLLLITLIYLRMNLKKSFSLS